MLRRTVLAGCLCLLPAIASAQRSQPWDGVWGHPQQAMVTVRGNSVLYHWQGQRQQISGLSMTAERIAFRLRNGRTITMVRTPDGRAQMTTQMPRGQPQSWSVWRGG